MNILILTIILLFTTILAYFHAQKRLTSIALWSNLMMFFSAGTYMLNIDFLGGDISVETLLIILLAIAGIFVGEVLGKYLIRKNKFHYREEADNNKSVIPFKYALLSTIIIITIAAYKLYDMLEYMATKGLSDEFLVIAAIRSDMTEGIYTFSVTVQILTSLATALAYIFAFYFFYNKICKKITKYYLLLPLIAQLFLLATSTGRTGYMEMFLIILGISYLLMKKSPYVKNPEKKFIKYFIITILLILVFFFLYGAFLRGSDRTLGNYFSSYFAVAIYGLDHMLNFPWVDNQFVGEYTLGNYYYYANKIFDTNFIIPEHHLVFFSYGGGQSNIYTSLALPYHDYGLIGLLITRIIIALGYTCLEISLLKSANILNRVTLSVIFGIMLYCNFNIGIADRYINMLSVTSFPSFVLFLFLCNKLYRKLC